MNRKIFSILLTGIVVSCLLSISASAATQSTPLQNTTRATNYYDFDWLLDDDPTEHNPWDATTDYAIKRKATDWSFKVDTFENLQYHVGYAMGVPDSGDLYSDFRWHKGISEVELYGKFTDPASEHIGDYMVLVGEINYREPSLSARAAGTWSPDA